MQAAVMTTIRMVEPADADVCVEVLAELPEFFTPDTHDDVRAGVVKGRGWVAVDGDSVVGFVLVEMRFPASAEVTYAAVRPTRRRSGIGTALIDVVLSELARLGVAVVEVKTLDASAGYEPYVATRAFWENCGFRQIDCIDPLPGWQPGNPSAIYVAALSATR